MKVNNNDEIIESLKTESITLKKGQDEIEDVLSDDEIKFTIDYINKVKKAFDNFSEKMGEELSKEEKLEIFFEDYKKSLIYNTGIAPTEEENKIKIDLKPTLSIEDEEEYKKRGIITVRDFGRIWTDDKYRRYLYNLISLENINFDDIMEQKKFDFIDRVILYRAALKIKNDFTGNKQLYNRLVKEAKQEQTIGKAITRVGMTASVEENERFLIRKIFKEHAILNDKSIMSKLEKMINAYEKSLKASMIRTIQSSASFLDEYGILDEYISDSNEAFKKMGIPETIFQKRNPVSEKFSYEFDIDKLGNPIPKVKANKETPVKTGNRLEQEIEEINDPKPITDKEDMGILDYLSTRELKRLPIEDLMVMTAFWESKFSIEKYGFSSAMQAINKLGLRGSIADDGDIKVEPQSVREAIAIQYILDDLYRRGYGNSIEPDKKVEKAYNDTIKKIGIRSIKTNKSAWQAIKDSKLENKSKDTTNSNLEALQELLLLHVKDNGNNIKEVGLLDLDEGLFSGGRGLAIEYKNFRMPLTMWVRNAILTGDDRISGIFEEEELKRFKTYSKKDLANDKDYSTIMSEIFLPTSKYYINTIKKAYEDNPNNLVLAQMCNKKVTSDDFQK